MRIHEACDYIIFRATAADMPLNLLKLQKLLYYSQAWSLAIDDKPLFEGKFQAWIHGPVNREIYDRFSGCKAMYSAMMVEDMNNSFDPDSLPSDEKRRIDSVLDAYGAFTGSQLEEMTHNETPWVKARDGFRPTERCEVEMDEALMKECYSSRLN